MRQIKIVLLLMLLLVSFTKVKAQNISGISIGLSQSYENIFTTDILPRFQQNYPDVVLEIRTIPSDIEQNLNLLRSDDDPRAYFEAMEQLSNLADVLLIPPNILSPESTRTGFLLDLAPLLSADNELNPDDFTSTAWDAFQWDGGHWAIPLTVAPQVMVYDRSSFDELGLSYPTSEWSFQEYISTARIFAENGQAGLFVPDSELNAFIYMLYGEAIYSSDPTENFNFDSDIIIDFIMQWRGLLREGTVTNQYSQVIPMQMTRFININRNRDYEGVLINGQAPIDVFGVAISRGSRNIQSAYDFASFLSTAPEVTELYPTSMHARATVQNMREDDTTDGLSEDELLLREEAIENSFSPSIMMFDHVLARWLNHLLDMPENEAERAFTLAQHDVDNLFALIDEFSNKIRVDVQPPLNEILPEDGEVIIDFAVFVNSGSGMSNRRLWEDVIEDFLVNNPDIDQIQLNDIPPLQGYWDEIRSHTCIHNYPYSLIEDINLILPLDPLIQADPTFSDADVVGNIMTDVQEDGVIYGLPHAISGFPILRYDRNLFALAGLPEPDGTWTVSEFIDTLQQLDTVTDGAPLHFYSNSTLTWEMLMAGFGGAPIDYSTTPPTPNLTDETVIASVQQVFDIPKNGLSTYYPTATFFGYAQPATETPALIIDTFNFGESINLEHYGYVNFPDGLETTPISFGTAQSFIFANEQHPEACYRWLREISRHPELFTAMPAYHSVINSNTTRAVYGDSGVATFESIAMRLEAPNQVSIGLMGSGVNMFLGRAFDRYVLEDADLVTELELAQGYITDFYACHNEINDINEIFWQCLYQIDPTIFELIEDRLIPEEYHSDQ